MLEKIEMVFSSIGKGSYTEKEVLSEPQCLFLAEAYDREIRRKNEAYAQGKFFMTVLNSFEDRFGRICSQIYEVLPESVQLLGRSPGFY